MGGGLTRAAKMCGGLTAIQGGKKTVYKLGWYTVIGIVLEQDNQRVAYHIKALSPEIAEEEAQKRAKRDNQILLVAGVAKGRISMVK
jgi:hypothetical protein